MSAPSSPHSVPAAEVLDGLGVDPDQGLDRDSVRKRSAEHGPNRLEERRERSRLRILAHQFDDVLVWVLVAAAAISGLLLGEWVDAGVISAIVVLNAGLGFLQETRAEEALAGLEAMAAPKATVIREGSEREIPAEELVSGDVVLLEAGDRVPADGRLVDIVGLEVDEAVLTGESMPVGKDTAPVEASAGVGDRCSMVFSGTTVVRGRGKAVVTAIGTSTEMGQIAGLLEEESPPTPLERELDRVGRRLGGLALGVAVAIFLLGLAQDRPLESMFLLAVALAVAAIPEGLPAVVTVTLARGVQRMAGRHAIVRRLPAVEALGAATVICTDKTGTLTRNEIWVQEADLADLHLVDLDRATDDSRVRRYAELAVLCNDAHRTNGGWSGDPTEVALLRSAEEVVDVDEVRSRRPRVAEAPFDSERKRMSTVHRADGDLLLAVKGAPEVVIPRCDRFEGVDGAHPLPAERADRALEVAEEMAARGLRTMAIAYRPLEVEPASAEEAEEQLVLVAVTGMRDELREEAPASVTEAREAGIEVVMVTGDHEVTARAIAGELGLLQDREVMPGRKLAETTVEDLADGVDRYGAYARVDPADKVKIIKAWQSKGAIVAMTGDGVNDAPALRIADIGVAMGSGTDVARDASDMVLTDDNFATIVGAVREGRTIFSNLRRVVSFLLAANVSEVVVVLIGFILWGGLGEPLLATQLLWVNLITDGLPALALGVDPPDPDVMRRAPQRRSVLGWRRQVRLLVTGTLLAVPILAVFGFGVARELPWEAVRTGGFAALVAVQMGYMYALKIGESGWRAGIMGNRALALAVALSVVLHVGVVTTPIGNRLFDTVPIQASDWVAVVVAAVAAFVVVLAAGRVLDRLERE